MKDEHVLELKELFVIFIYGILIDICCKHASFKIKLLIIFAEIQQVAFTISDSSICPSSLAQYWTNKNYECFRCVHKTTTQQWRYTPVPDFNDSELNKEDVWEWLGDVSCEAEV